MASYEIEFSTKELVYFLFRRKKCPICKQKLERTKKTTPEENEVSSLELGKKYVGPSNKVELYYSCGECNKLFTLTDLSNNK